MPAAGTATVLFVMFVTFGNMFFYRDAPFHLCNQKRHMWCVSTKRVFSDLVLAFVESWLLYFPRVSYILYFHVTRPLRCYRYGPSDFRRGHDHPILPSRPLCIIDVPKTPPQDTLWSPQQREDMSQLNNRVTRFLERIPTREEGHVFIVSHGVFMEAAIRQLTDAYPG